MILLCLQLDLIDMQSCPDEPFKFLLNYRDAGIKLYDCYPLTSKRSAAIALGCLSMWSLIGPPGVLGCDNGKEFAGLAEEGSEKKKAKTPCNIATDVNKLVNTRLGV